MKWKNGTTQKDKLKTKSGYERFLSIDYSGLISYLEDHLELELSDKEKIHDQIFKLEQYIREEFFVYFPE